MAAVSSCLVVRPVLANQPAAAQADTAADITRARTLYREAQTAFANESYEKAQEKLLEAWAIRKTFDVASALAQVELELKQFRSAAEHAEYCLRVFAPAESEETLKTVQQLYSDAKSHVGLIRLSIDRTGAELYADGATLGTAPRVAPLFLEPGQHTIEARIQGSVASRSLTVEAGKDYGVTLELKPTSSSSVSTNGKPNDANSPALNQPRGERNFGPVYWTLSVGGGLTAVALVSGLLFREQASSKQDSSTTIQDRVSTCRGVTSANCGQLISLADERNTANKSAQVAVGLAGVFAVATGAVTYLVWPTKNPNESYGTTAWATPSGAGVSVVGRF